MKKQNVQKNCQNTWRFGVEQLAIWNLGWMFQKRKTVRWNFKFWKCWWTPMTIIIYFGFGTTLWIRTNMNVTNRYELVAAEHVLLNKFTKQCGRSHTHCTIKIDITRRFSRLHINDNSVLTSTTFELEHVLTTWPQTWTCAMPP